MKNLNDLIADVDCDVTGFGQHNRVLAYMPKNGRCYCRVDRVSGLRDPSVEEIVKAAKLRNGDVMRGQWRCEAWDDQGDVIHCDLIQTRKARQGTFTFFSDAGHGWLKVPKAMLVDLGIAGEISHYSYQYGDYAYLEEDCDMGIFIQAYKGRGFNFEYRTRNSDYSRIRAYQLYSA
jgi:hypothetical protein